MKSESDPLAHHLLVALKAQLRERHIGYQRIADAMEVSLPTVKRMLNKTSLPLDRLLTICRIASIEPAELFASAKKNRPQHTHFTPEQDQLFFDRPEFSSYFMRLILNGESPAEIAASEGLSDLSTERYLSGLEKVGLLERGTGSKIHFNVSPPLGFAPDSKVLRAQHVTFLEATVEKILSPEASGTFAILKPMQLPKESFRGMIDELKATVDKFAYLSEHPKVKRDNGAEPFNLAIAAAPSDQTEQAAPIVDLD